MDFFLLTNTFSSRQWKIFSTFLLSILGVTKLTNGTTINPATMAMAPALIGDAINLKNILATVIPTPQAKLAQTAALVTPLQIEKYQKRLEKQ